MSSGSIEVGESAIHYDTVGAGRAVLFVHAGVADSRMWNAQFDEIEGFRLVRFDMRGYGRSSLGSQRFSNRDDALAVLDHLEIDTAVVVGCSIGGHTALEIAHLAPHRMAGLILVGAAAPGFDSGIEYESPEWPEAIAAFEAGDLQRVAELDAEMWLAGSDRSCSDLQPELVELFIEMDLIALRNEGAREELDAGQPLEQIPETGCPGLVVVGEHDIPQMIAAADRLADSLSDQPPVVIGDSAHLPSMDRPGTFNARLTEFLERF